MIVNRVRYVNSQIFHCFQRSQALLCMHGMMEGHVICILSVTQILK